MEYTLAIIVAGFFIGILDAVLQTHIVLRPNQIFWKTAITFLLFQLIFDNLFTYWGVWSFNSAETIGIFVPFIPIENLFFGLEMLCFTLIFYQKIKNMNRKIKV